MMAGLLFARAGVQGRGAREACATSSAISAATPSTPRRWRSSTSSACSNASSSGRTTRSTRRATPDRRARLDDRRPVAPRHARAVHRDDAAMGVPRFPARRGDGLSRLSRCEMEAPVAGFIEEDGRIAGVRLADGARASRASWPSPPTAAPRSSARLAAARGPRRADGRLLVPPRQDRPPATGGAARHVEPGRMLVLIDRGDYWQCAFLIPKGAAEAIKARGIDAIREEVAEAAPGPRSRRARRDQPTSTC